MGKIGIKFNHNYFEHIDSEEKSYFLGFIMADGCVIKDRNSLAIKIHKKDEHILESFKECIEFEGDLWYHKQRTNMCQISMSHVKLKEDLNNLGVVSNKTHTLKFPKLRKDLYRHFIRGFFDGDGCVRIKKDKRRSGSVDKRGDVRFVCGSLGFLNDLNILLHKEIDTNLNKLYGKYESHKYIGWCGFSDIENLYEYFYNDANLFLHRKKLIFDEVYNICKQRNKYRKK